MQLNNKDDECVICFENKKNNEHVFRLHNCLAKMNYYTHCNCNYFVHKNCMLNWFEFSKICLICKQNVLYLNNDSQNRQNTINMYYYEIKKSCKTIIKILIKTITMYILLHTHLYVLYSIIRFYSNFYN